MHQSNQIQLSDLGFEEGGGGGGGGGGLGYAILGGGGAGVCYFDMFYKPL